jgi:N-acetylglucosamine-6-phosphate deacetylase
MASFCLRRGVVLTPLRTLVGGTIVVEGDRIVAVSDKNTRLKPSCHDIDVRDLYVAPGFIDLHVHGGGGRDVMEGSLEALEAIAVAHAEGGTTSWLATTLTAPQEQILAALSAIETASQLPLKGAKILGAHLEGPYFNPEQAGAQNPAYLKLPCREEYETILNKFSCIKRVSVAPELPGGLELGAELKRRGILASIGHSNATYQEVLAAVEAGFSHVTHIYSGMSIIRRVKAYRVAGVLEATLLLDTLTTEMIADGHHLPPSLMRLVLKTKGTDRVCIVTDAIAPAGLGPGHYQLGGLEIVVESNVPDEYEICPAPNSYVAKLADRTAFAGSVARMNVLVHNLITLVGVPLAEAVKMATFVPARILGVTSERGLIAPGLKADLVVFDEQLNVHLTIVEGKIVYRSDRYH